ncbi:hypothetical protein Ccar_16485 [Clostridium carboxidivorans P7]|uniref:DUF2634 domain-containing protein n=1 Tax=Clostridium carboxidivorans TaxID=217159 RepID=UPI00064E8869|nr:DUF2634 domain-containing protein [Clostridium carboxidivorans]AKN32372.1 hypothetical protein Ccar_16485 [Clostridium carboxidivorans P7]
MSIFPEVPQINLDINLNSNQAENLPLLKEFAWDFNKNCFILVDGRFKVVVGVEAIKIWIYKSMKTVRKRFKAYSEYYGNECEKLIGYQSVEFVKAEAERYIKEALLISLYIKSINNIKVAVTGKKFEISFTANTVYGEVSVVA